jgi:hypothetical protein
MRRLLTPAAFANEMEIVPVGLLFADADTFTMLPDITPLASDAMCAVINLTVGSTDTVEDPVVGFVFKFL